MTLHGGPFNGKDHEDIGTTLQKLCVFEGRIPVKGCKVGIAVYEPTPDRSKSFYLETIWDGSTLEQIIDT